MSYSRMFRSIENHNIEREKSAFLEMRNCIEMIYNEPLTKERINLIYLFTYNWPYAVVDEYDKIMNFMTLDIEEGAFIGIILGTIKFIIKENIMKINTDIKIKMSDSIYYIWSRYEMTQHFNQDKLSKVIIDMKHAKFGNKDSTKTLHFYCDMLYDAYQHNKLHLIRKYTWLTMHALFMDITSDLK